MDVEDPAEPVDRLSPSGTAAPTRPRTAALSTALARSRSAADSKARVSTFGRIASHIRGKKTGKPAHVRKRSGTPVTRSFCLASW
jgi:hypothetical protein